MHNTINDFYGVMPHSKSIFPPQVLIPLAVWAGSPSASRRHRAHFVILSVAGLFGLLPLIFRPEEYIIKHGLVLVYLAAVVPSLLQPSSRATGSGGAAGSAKSRLLMAPSNSNNGLAALEVAYLVGFFPLELYASFAHEVVAGSALPFLPLLLTSVYCAVGITWVWLNMSLSYALGDVKNGGY